MVVNMNMKSQAENSINDYLCDTIAEVFPHVYRVSVEGSTNMEVFASVSEKIPENLEQNGKELESKELRELMGKIGENLEVYQSQGRILTDDKAPVELLGMKVLDEIIGEELEHYREMYLG